MAIPLACEVSEHLSDDLLTKLLVLSLVVREAIVLVALLKAELFVIQVKLRVIIAINEIFIFLAFFWCSKQVLGCWVGKSWLLVGRTIEDSIFLGCNSFG